MPKGIAKNGKRKSSPRVERIAHICEVCGKERFYTPKEIQKREKYAKLRFCSVECRDTSRKNSERQRRLAQRKPKPPRVPVICEHCGVIVLKPPSEVKVAKKHFCSRECMDANKTTGLPRKEYMKLYLVEYNATTRDKRNQQHREWDENNREKKLDIQRRYRDSHRDEIVALHHQRRTRTEQGTFTGDDWRLMKQFYDYTCLCCGRREPEIKLTLDHIHPIVCGGLHQFENIQPLCKSCNSTKNTKKIDYRPSLLPQTPLRQLSMF